MAKARRYLLYCKAQYDSMFQSLETTAKSDLVSQAVLPSGGRDRHEIWVINNQIKSNLNTTVALLFANSISILLVTCMRY